MNDIGKRIVVMGSPGAGKTTFSDKLRQDSVVARLPSG